MAIEIPTRSDLPLFSQITALDGKDYLLTFSLNSRDDRWYLTVSDENGALLADSVKLVVNFPLLRNLQDPNAPRGVLYLNSEGGAECGPNDLGSRCALIYTTKDEISALFA